MLQNQLKLYSERSALIKEILTYIGVTETEWPFCEHNLHQCITGLGEALAAIKEVDSDITGECSEELITKILVHLAKYKY